MTPQEKREVLRAIKSQIEAGQHGAAWTDLRRIAAPGDEFALQDRYSRTLARIPAKAIGLTPIRIALLATSTVDHLASALRFWLATAGFALELYQSEYGTMQQMVLDPSSELYHFKPDLVWLFTGGRDVALDGDPDAQDPAAAVTAAVARTRSLWMLLQERLPAQIVQNNADLDPVRTFGNFEGAVPWSRTNLLRAYNVELARATGPGVTLFDLDYLSGEYGRRAWYDARWWYVSKHAVTLEALGLVAHAFAQVVAGIMGRAKKCVVLDLDNTLWGGVIGDDGLEGIKLGEGDATGEAHLAFQRYLLRLKDRGIILAVASKNQPEAARLPFEEHPEMVLRPDDIAIFRANWVDKATNIREIAETLNIGLDSLVFIDDNPVERALIRGELPMVEVPEVGDDAATYRETLDRGLFFETVTFSRDDRMRAEAYRMNAKRAEEAATATDLTSFLQGLTMTGTVGRLDDFNLPRFAQLLNKSNQFHLTTTRYTEAQLRAIMADPQRVCLYFRLEDRFGDNGLIGTIVLDLPKDPADPLDHLRIDTWAMSCRVLSRGMEAFIMAEIRRHAGHARIIGHYIPTAKNSLVKGLYERLGLRKIDDINGTTVWELRPDDHVDYSNHIKRVEATRSSGSSSSSSSSGS